MTTRKLRSQEDTDDLHASEEAKRDGIRIPLDAAMREIDSDDETPRKSLVNTVAAMMIAQCHKRKDELK